MKFITRLMAVFLIVCLVFVASCVTSNDGNDSNQKADEMIRLGKQYLTDGQPQAAKLTFQEVIEKYSPDNSEAHFGIAISEAMSFVEFFNLVISLVGGLADTQRVAMAPLQISDENEFIIDLVTDLLRDVGERFQLMLVHMISAKNDPGFVFVIDDLPIVVDEQERLNLRGEWDNTELKLMVAGVEMIIATIELLGSQDLHADFLGVYEYLAADGFNDIDLPMILNTVAFLINHSPAFLTINKLLDDDGNDGLEYWDIGVTLFEEASINMLEALSYLENETDLQTGDLLRIIDDPENPGTRVIYFSGLVEEIDENGEPIYSAISIGFDPFRNLVYAMDESINGSGRISWIEDLLPVLVEGVLTLIDVISVVGVELPEEVQSIVDTISPDTLEEIIIGFVPDVFQMDLGAFLKNPVDMRTFLPLVTSDPDDDKNIVLMEWECPLEFISGFPDGSTVPDFPTGSGNLMCADDVPVVDSVHFPDGDHAQYASYYENFVDEGLLLPIAEDGIASKLPYIPMGDASFNGLLYVNPCSPDFADPGIPAYISSAAGCFSRADVRSFNAVLHALINPYITDLEDFSFGE
jgi:hypothetical protein